MNQKPGLTLETPIRYLKGAGPKMARRLKKLNIETVDDLISHFPFRHEDYSLVSPINKTQEGEIVTLIGKISKIENNYLGSKTIQKAILKDQTGTMAIVWFNQSYLVKALAPPTIVSLSGKIRRRGGQLQLIAPDFEVLSQGKKISSYQIGENVATSTGRLVPIYPATYGVTNKYLRRLLARALPEVKGAIKEFLPFEIIKKEKLIPEKEAILKIHFPENKIALEKAKKRLSFDELFLHQIKTLTKKHFWQKKNPAPALKPKPEVLKKFINSLPFKLTKDQKKSIKEIISDLEKPQAMNRLLQGDVGSGKTVVAAAAALVAVKNNYQSALMVPTEILAQQHYANLRSLLQDFGIKTSLLTGSTKKSEAKKTSQSNLIIGTHALIHKRAKFKRVGLAIIDEQHRFGVSQRAKLIKKANLADKDRFFPHILTMTATPIPRTIALTFYGDLDVSSLDQMPSGRKPVKTYLIPPSKREDCYAWIKKQILEKKIQAFVICPLIEESETLEAVKDATGEYRKMKKIFSDFRVSLLHGRMKSREKEKILLQMKAGEIDLLVATPVVEVGIDLPGANIIVIETANRFGLAQLHQLRGRVGRSGKQAYCFLFASQKSKKSGRRLKAMEQINQGLKLAEIDLELRGPGEIYGTLQHGFPEFKIASCLDLELIQKTRRAAQKIIGRDPNFSQNSELKKKINKSLASGPVAPN